MDPAGEPRVGSIFARNMIHVVEARTVGCRGFRCQLYEGFGRGSLKLNRRTVQ